MRRRGALRVVVLVACLLGFTTACRGRAIVDDFGLSTPPPFVLGERMPDDFGIGIWTYDAAQPRSELDVELRADGSGSWRVWVPATKVESAQGELHIEAAHVASVWNAVVDAKFDRIETGDTSPDVCSGGASGIQRFAVLARGAERYVWRPPGAADVEGIRTAVLDLVPRDVAAQFTRASPR